MALNVDLFVNVVKQLDIIRWFTPYGSDKSWNSGENSQGLFYVLLSTMSAVWLECCHTHTKGDVWLPPVVRKSDAGPGSYRLCVWSYAKKWITHSALKKKRPSHVIELFTRVYSAWLIQECRSIMFFFIIYLRWCFCPPGHRVFLSAIQQSYLISSIFHPCPLVPLLFYIASHMVCPALSPVPIYLH